MKSYILKGGRVIDPANDIDSINDVLVVDEKIVAVGLHLDDDPTCKYMVQNAEVIDCRDRLVLPGLIDTHGHIFQNVTGRFGLNPDLVGVHSGVTTVIDQGGASCITLPAFRKFIQEPSKTRILSFISAYLVGGLEGHFYPELYRPACVDVDATVKSICENRDLARGIKAHAEIGGFSRWGIEVMKKASMIGKQSELPVYIHFGQLWPLPESGGMEIAPDEVLRQVVPLMKEGDILAHPFTRHPGGFVGSNGEIHPLVREGLARGLKIDVGHGSHFSFRIAQQVIDGGIIPDTLGADMHGYNTAVPAPPGTPEEHPDPDEGHIFAGNARFSLASAMTSMMALGLNLEQVIPMVTTHAAKMAGMEDEIGTLGVGRKADITVLSDQAGLWRLRDNEGNMVFARRLVEPLFCLKNGEFIPATASILPVAETAD
ncbi:dihydroorotase [Tatumella morbirosei]|uniref:Dihydroorotase n=1 Tax=Tatumella morbirosei TaxID=642227 RepID=A0A095UK81_9GAMM|nr:amidohydrolase/deacetylase family metallohydrolase [Tatumella morbirosei]KGD74858.1 dihydroorotase [Tatumella morbirosei]